MFGVHVGVATLQEAGEFGKDDYYIASAITQKILDGFINPSL